MNFKRGIMVISICICILFMISSVYSTDDIETGANSTLSYNENQELLQDVQEDNCDEERNEDELNNAEHHPDSACVFARSDCVDNPDYVENRKSDKSAD